MRGIFLHEKPVEILSAIAILGDPSISDIAREVKSPFAHTTKTLRRMEGLGLIEIEAKKRAKIVRLTDEGFKVYEKFVDLLSLFEGVKMERGDESSFQKLKEMEDRIEKIEDARPELLAPHLRDLQLMKREIKNKIILEQITVLENRIETKLNRY
jgi:hypothetical protein